jgi:hypothetical protein
MKQAVGEMQVAIFIEAKKMAPHEFPKLTGHTPAYDLAMKIFEIIKNFPNEKKFRTPS